jgi:site-specific DNA recombinase
MKPEVIEPNKKNSGEKMKVSAYARVSTNSISQEDSYENQVKYYEKLIKSNPEYEYNGVFADQAVSGTTDKRPEFQSMIRQAEFGNIDLIITKNISRFSRNIADLYKYISKLKDLGVGVFFEEENINTLESTGNIFLSLLGSIAQMEVENTSSHIQWTLNKKMENSELVGQPNPLGYDVIEEEQEIKGRKVVVKKLIVNEEEAEIVKFIFSEYLQGVGTHTIAKKLQSMGKKTKKGNSKWHDSTVTGILKNEKYTGVLVQGKTFTKTPIGRIRKTNNGERTKYVTKNHHEAIISEDDFNRVKEIMNSRCITYSDGRKKGTTRNSKQSVFTSKIRCAYCGKNYVRRIVHKGTKSEKAIWQCSTYAKQGKRKCPKCKSIDEELIKFSFVNLVKELMTKTEFPAYLSDESFEKYLEIAKQNNESVINQLNDSVKQLENFKRQHNKLIDLLLEDSIDKEEFNVKREELLEKIENQNKFIDELKKQSSVDEYGIKNAKEIKELINNNDIEGFDVRLFNKLVDYVEIGGIEKRRNGEPVDNPKKIHFVIDIAYLDRHSISYYKNNPEFNKMIESIDSKMNKIMNSLYSDDTCGDGCITVQTRCRPAYKS